ncbi:hypothetical protein RCL_jg17360.t1 [Rhizophagus clarus]|uniref:Uncharacterized protein n=1 Tax=Rhizophagus clarus TaxID=94130 RepID=A0A8H3L0X0_9GLOM|nr:hypothetical protein RCL_jg17360.t1 [Rhizophagus clarus]
MITYTFVYIALKIVNRSVTVIYPPAEGYSQDDFLLLNEDQIKNLIEVHLKENDILKRGLSEKYIVVNIDNIFI